MPGMDILMAKKDVKDAFRWVVMHEMDACIFGADLEGGKWGVAALITAVYMVLTFGWTGSPGEWMIWAWVAKCYHAAYRPADARWDDDVPFHSSCLMDDQVLVEPDHEVTVEHGRCEARAALPPP